jgi:hypothetical protein
MRLWLTQTSLDVILLICPSIPRFMRRVAEWAVGSGYDPEANTTIVQTVDLPSASGLMVKEGLPVCWQYASCKSTRRLQIGLLSGSGQILGANARRQRRFMR